MDRLDAMQLYVAVVDAHSFARAAEVLGHRLQSSGPKPHQNHKKHLYPRFQPAVRYFVTSSIAFFYR